MYDKTKLMLFNKRDKQYPDVYMNGVQLEWVNNFKYLGVIIDDKLSFSSHAKLLTTIISSVLGMLYASRQFFNIKASITIYYSLVYSLFTQSIIIYGSTYDIHCVTYKSINKKNFEGHIKG